MKPRRLLLWTAAALLALAAGARHGAADDSPVAVVLDDFEELSRWSAIASEGARVEISSGEGYRGRGMRIDFDFQGAGGYVNVQKTFSLPLPSNYSFSFYIRGEAPANDLEFKLIDPSGQNVWWRNQRRFEFPREWRSVTIRKSHIDFAWGPSSGTILKHIGAVEFSIAVGEGGRGSVWIDELELGERLVVLEYDLVPEVSGSTAAPGHEAAQALDGNPATAWRSEAGSQPQWLQIDFFVPREYGGLIVDWDAEDYATAYDVLVSADGEEWTRLHSVTGGNGSRDYIYLPDAESRYLRLDLTAGSRGAGYGIAEIAVQPFEFGSSPNGFFGAIARQAPRGSYPRYLLDEQTYWTVVGVDGDAKEALLNEDGMIELEEGSFSLEPFVEVDGELLTWSSVDARQEMLDGYLPIPTVTWRGPLNLRTTAVASGPAGSSTLYVRYEIENESEHRRSVRLFVAVRPFQVNPPWQSLRRPGGVSQIRQLAYEDGVLRVNDAHTVRPLTPPDGFGAVTFEQGPLLASLRLGHAPRRTHVFDPSGFAAGAFEFRLEVPASGRSAVLLAVPWYSWSAEPPASEDPASLFDAAMQTATRTWRERLSRVEIEIPARYGPYPETLRATIAYILINRDGPAIQPGSRNYARSWIRDGAITSSALLQMGFTAEVRQYLEWFALRQLPNGKIPCCVDERGADPTPEHDSQGEFIYAVAEYYRFTHDVGFLHQMWPHVVGAVRYLEELRGQRLTEKYQEGELRLFRGLLPESISHEGYASNPVHSYWDDFFAVRGFADAAWLAVVMGEPDHAAHFAELRESFRADLYASIEGAIKRHRIEYVPGSADLGDFDPTSTAIALTVAGELTYLPQAALKQTFERYYEFFRDRRDGTIQWEAYTPYEIRNVEALVRLDRVDRAHEVLRYLFDSRRPEAWNHWGEIVWREARAARFIGDMPHTWVGSGFVRSFRALFAYERDLDDSLVLGGGLPLEWLDGDGVRVRRLPTYYGVVNYDFRRTAATTLELRLSGDVHVPRGGIVVHSPGAAPLRTAAVNGVPVSALDARAVVVRVLPAVVTLEY